MINSISEWTLLSSHTGMLLFKLNTPQVTIKIEQVYCKLQIEEQTFYAKLEQLTDPASSGFYVYQKDSYNYLYYCLLPQQTNIGYKVDLINFESGGTSIKLENKNFSVTGSKFSDLKI